MARQLSQDEGDGHTSSCSPRTPAPRRAAAVPSKGPEGLAPGTKPAVGCYPSLGLRGVPDGSNPPHQRFQRERARRGRPSSLLGEAKKKKPKGPAAGEAQPWHSGGSGCQAQVSPMEVRLLWVQEGQEEKRRAMAGPASTLAGPQWAPGKPQGISHLKSRFGSACSPTPPRGLAGCRLSRPTVPSEDPLPMPPASPGVSREEAAKPDVPKQVNG